VEEYIATTPAFKAVGLDENKINFDWNECKRVAKVLYDELHELENEATVEKIHGYYIPVYVWLKEQMRRQKSKNARAAVIGWTAPQGGMKTIVGAALVKAFEKEGINCVALGADDFYLTRTEQAALSEKYKSNSLLQYRGNPGTMDVNLMIDTISKLRETNEGDEVRIPRYDKSAYSGLGDRCPEEEWSVIKGRVDLVVLEGWCLGFEPVEQTDGDLVKINEFLRDYARVYDYVDAFLVCQVDDVSWVYTWRQQAEDRMRKRGKEGMSPERIREFVDRFMPAYKQYLPKLYSEDILPGRPQLNLKLDFNRIPTE